MATKFQLLLEGVIVLFPDLITFVFFIVAVTVVLSHGSFIIGIFNAMLNGCTFEEVIKKQKMSFMQFIKHRDKEFNEFNEHRDNELKDYYGSD